MQQRKHRKRIWNGRLLATSFENVGRCFQIGGDEFCVLAENAERVFFEAAIRNMEEKVSTLKKDIEGYGIAISVAEGASRDIEDIFYVADDALRELYGYSNEEDAPNTWDIWLRGAHPEDREYVEKEFLSAL